MKPSAGLIVVLAVVGVIILLGFGGAWLYVTYRNLDRSLSPVVDELFARIQDGTFAQTYDTHTTEEFRRVVPRDQYQALADACKTYLGALQSKTLQQFNFRGDMSGSYAFVAYAAHFERGPATITVTFKKAGDRWLILNWNVQSPVFQQALAQAACPHCGNPHGLGAKFCPNCGKPLTTDESASADKAPAATP
ncbi:MAG: hypothetical protein KatS3mg110_2113 [Pirellulaceae bacterium]|nr:MAG: hypothetical protein KatS3mg110_2113 [Pirellulaceae bacterium]